MVAAGKRKDHTLYVPMGMLLNGEWRGLIVDDDDTSRASAKLALEGERIYGRPIKLEFASSAREAIEILSADSRFVFAILDVMMESNDSGLGLIDWIRSRPELAAMRLAIRTGYSGPHSPEETIQKYDIFDYRAKTELSRGKFVGIVASMARSWVEISSACAGEKAMAALAKGSLELNEAQSSQFFLLALGKAGRDLVQHGLFEAHFKPFESLNTLEKKSDTITAPGLPDIIVNSHPGSCWPSQEKALRSLLSSAQSAYTTLSAIKKLEAMAYADPVTGLANRRRLMQWLERDLEAGEPLGVMIIDVDHFKKINDRLGHEAGDKLLKTLGDRMSKACEIIPSRAARLGGDEFCVLFRCHDESSGMSAASDWLQFLEGVVPLGMESVDPHFSAGLSFSSSGAPGEVLRNADVAMYQAKKTGRGRLCLHQQGGFFDAPKRERGARLAKGLADGELVPLFQPIIDATSGRCCAFEIYARWRQPDGELVLPGDFLPMAHETGVARSIDLWMANQALLASQHLHGRVQFRINLDSKQACDETFAEELSLSWVGQPSHAFAVEILESAAFPDIEKVKKFTHRLASNGHEISLDHFGSGNSSLTFLSRLPIGSIKIDAHLSRSLACDSDVKLAKSTAAVAKVYGIDCMGTGIETLQEVKTLLSWGALRVQGHVIAPAMEWEATLSWLTLWENGASARWLDELSNLSL